ncbi:Cyclic nucleotide-binding domain-containing protein [Plasmodiophora brassicae]|uniref:cAMP-dependent protein kinase regulatory subunit n=1 Tax=Plasmodiophora brassicae TaxID=37360 RepID=A0A3P3Y877_PLABS|nr:unnamed protein product [Plasmodiophora brassicae]
MSGANGDSASYATELERVSRYAQTKIDGVLKDMLEQLFLNTPEDPIDFMIGFLTDYKERGPSSTAHSLRASRRGSAENAMDLSDDVSHLPAETTPRGKARRRTAVSAEPVHFMASADAPASIAVPKTQEQLERIDESVRNNILFSSLSADQLQMIFDAMAEKRYAAGESIIKQGEEGDYFYVLDSGTANCYVSVDGAPPKLVKTYTKGGSFGELALMYNSPRAATIIAQTDVVCWAVDRITFRKMLMETTSTSRRKYEQFLGAVKILASLDQSERARVADALVEQNFKDGDYVIRQGETGEEFHIIVQGNAKVTKSLDFQDEPVTVLELHPGDYFGELALINQDVRAANVIAVGNLTTVTLDRGAFTRLLGPIDHILKRNTDNYNAIEQKIYNEKLQAVSGVTVVPQPLLGAGDANSTQLSMRRRRTAVSSEPVAAMTSIPSNASPSASVPKTPVQRASILKSIQGNFLFAGLDHAQREIILDAMYQKAYKDGEYVIRQGQPGDNFYILSKGEAECFVQKKDGPPVLVKTYKAGEGFGELALMYNSPRAASIRAKGDILVWVVDRPTFRRVVMDTTSQKRTLYEGFLGSVQILSSLDRTEIAKVADCLLEKSYQPGEYVIRQNEPGDNFYIIVDGEAVATKVLPGNTEAQEVMRYKRGDYFGELALLNDQPRAANVIAVDAPLKVVTLDRASFVRLLGPCDEILKRNSSTYAAIDAALHHD